MDSFDGILGLPFLRSVGAKLLFETDKLLTSKHRVKFMKKTWVETPVFQVEELTNIEEEVQDCFAALTREVNKNSAQLTASSNQVIPPYSRAYLRVACPQKLVGETMLVEPEALSNGLVIGGVCIQADKRNDHYLLVMNLSDTEENSSATRCILWMTGC